MDVNELIDNLRMPSWHDLEDPDATLLADASDALSTLQAENEKLKRALAEMWFAYVNKDGEIPHTYEEEAVELAQEILGPWGECMPKYLRRGSKVERYTEKVDGIWSVSCKYEEPPYPVVTQEVIDRLAAIEDILGDEYDLDRLRELVQADREGRCVVIRPNSVTDDNYKIICRKINAEDIHLRKMRNVHEKHK